MFRSVNEYMNLGYCRRRIWWGEHTDVKSNAMSIANDEGKGEDEEEDGKAIRRKRTRRMSGRRERKRRTTRTATRVKERGGWHGEWHGDEKGENKANDEDKGGEEVDGDARGEEGEKRPMATQTEGRRRTAW